MKKTDTKVRSSDNWFERNWRLIVSLLIITIAAGAIFFFVLKPPPEFRLSARISNLPDNYSSITIVTTHISLPLNAEQKNNYERFIDSLGEVIPTVFVMVTESSANVTEDIDYLLQFNVDYGILAPPGFSSLDYTSQESSIWSYKDILQSLSPRGLRTADFSANYDTLLAAENAQLNYISVIPQEGEPQHPDSVLGGKMNIILFPISTEPPVGQEIWTMAIAPSVVDFSDSSALMLSMTQVSEWIREKDKTGVEITSDIRELISDVRVTQPNENSSLALLSNLKAINVSAGNRSVDFSYRNGELIIPLSKEHRLFRIQWSE